MQMTDRFIYLLGIMLLSSVTWSMGCKPHTSTVQPAPPTVIRNIVCFDRSKSTLDQHEDFLNMTDFIYRESSKEYNAQEVEIYALDNSVSPVTHPEVPHEDKLPSFILHELNRTDFPDKTLPVKFWRDMDRKYSNYANPIKIALITDGASDDYDDRAEIKGLIERLAKNKNVYKLIIYGVVTEQSRFCDEICEPFLKSNRLIIANRGQHQLMEDWMASTP